MHHVSVQHVKDLKWLFIIPRKENLKTYPNATSTEVKFKTLQCDFEQNKKKMSEVDSRNKTAEEQNQKLKRDLAKAQEELSRVRSLPTWKKGVAGTSENFKISSHQTTYTELEQNLMLKENTISQIQEDLLELTCNLQSRDKLIKTQQETIQVLQSSLKLEHEESEELRKKVVKLESQKDFAKIEYQQKIEELESTVNSLQDTRKKSDEASLRMKEGVSVLCRIMFSELKDQYHQFYQEAMKGTQNSNDLRDANIELATLCGHLQQEFHRSQKKLMDSYCQRSETEKKHQQATGALQIVIYNLNEKIKSRDAILESSKQEIKKLLDKATTQADTIGKCETKIQNLQKEINLRDEDVSSLNNKVAELQIRSSKQQELSGIFEASKRDQDLLQKKVGELSDELIKEREKTTKLSLELSLAVNEVQRERKLSEIHKQRIDEMTEALANKSEELSEMDLSYIELQNRFEESNKELKCLKEQMKILKKQLNAQTEHKREGEKELRIVQEKLLQVVKKEADIHQEFSHKENEWMERIQESQTEIYKLTDVISSLTDELSSAKLEIESDKSKNETTEQKLREALESIELLKLQLNEKEGITGKLHGALTHLSLKVVSNVQNLENKEALLKHCEEQVSQLQAMLQEKINQEEVKNDQIRHLRKELEKLRSQFDSEQKKGIQLSKKDSMIELLESKVENLTVELESCKYMKNRDAECVSALLSEKAEEMARKDEEIIALQLQLKKSSVQLESMRKLVDELRHELKTHSESADLELKHQSQQIVDNAQQCISEQRHYSLSLATQLRCTKQELKSIKQENRVLLDSVKSLKAANLGLEKELRSLHNEGLDSDLTFDLTHVRRSYELENFRSKSAITLDDHPLMEVKMKAGKNSTHSGLSSTSKAWQLSSGETDKSEYKNWKRRIQNLAQTTVMEDSKESVYYSSST